MLALRRYALGILYPAFMSFKSLDSPDSEQATRYWLTYWIVWSCMTVLEVFEAVALWIPFYYELKLALVVWLIHPQSKGAAVCFQQFVQPLLKKHEKDIDDGLTFAQEKAGEHLSTLRLKAEAAGFEFPTWEGQAGGAPGEVGDGGGLRQRGGGGGGGGGGAVAADPADPEAGVAAPAPTNKDDD